MQYCDALNNSVIIYVKRHLYIKNCRIEPNQGKVRQFQIGLSVKVIYAKPIPHRFTDEARLSLNINHSLQAKVYLDRGGVIRKSVWDNNDNY